MLITRPIQQNGLEIAKQRYRTFAENQGLAIAAEVQIREMHMLSAKGLTYTRARMRKYSVSYFQRKKKKYGSATPVNLWAEGDMLDSMNYDPQMKAVRPSIDQMNKAKWNQATRPFVGVDSVTKRKMVAEVTYRAPHEVTK